MNSQVAYVINTTPKYFYLLRLHLTLLQRYAADLGWPIFLATEEPNALKITTLKDEFPFLKIISLDKSDAGFFESRLAASGLLPANFKYVFPIQDDFLLEAIPKYDALNNVIKMMETDATLGSVRVMPCPGPMGGTLECATHDMIFSYQATIWRRTVYESFFQSIIDYTEKKYPGILQDPKRSAILAIKVNLAEINVGQEILRNICPNHLCIRRKHASPNAVYLAPWPYRPTAVVNGRLEDWAVDLAEREGCPI